MKIGLLAALALVALGTTACHGPKLELTKPVVFNGGPTNAAFRNSLAGQLRTDFLPGNRIEVLNNGDEFYPSMLKAIEQAQHSITIEAYIYWAGEIGLEFAQALAERAKAGVRVTILLDAIGSADIGPKILKTLEQGGCQVAWYNPIQWYTIGRFNNRTHRKSLIVDGEIAFGSSIDPAVMASIPGIPVDLKLIRPPHSGQNPRVAIAPESVRLE